MSTWPCCIASTNIMIWQLAASRKSQSNVPKVPGAAQLLPSTATAQLSSTLCGSVQASLPPGNRDDRLTQPQMHCPNDSFPLMPSVQLVILQRTPSSQAVDGPSEQPMCTLQHRAGERLIMAFRRIADIAVCAAAAPLSHAAAAPLPSAYTPCHCSAGQLLTCKWSSCRRIKRIDQAIPASECCLQVGALAP